MYFDFHTYLKVVRLVVTDKPSPKRLLVHGLILTLLSIWAVCNAVCLALDRLFFAGYRKIQIATPVFIVGNARSGTTLFHRLLCGDEERFVYFRTWEILFPSLLQKKTIHTVTAAYQWAFPRAAQRLTDWENRQLGEIKKQHPIGINKPEEDEFLLLLSFASSVIVVLFPYLDQLTELVTFDDRPAAAQRRIMGFYRECVQRQLAFHGGNRTLVSKNPAFVTKMRGLAREFPDAKFVYLIRNPFETLPSILKLLRTVWQQLGMDADHIERSTRSLASGCVRDYHYAMDVLAELPESRCAIVPYTELIADPKATVERVYDRLGLSISPVFARRLEAERTRQKHYQSDNVYSLEEFGLSEAEMSRGLADIVERFGFRPEQAPVDQVREMV
ncbi:MAG: sulfotransferase family protein [Candidatus Binatia bacterium]